MAHDQYSPDVQMEITVLGATILDPDAASETFDGLDDIDFSLDSHQRIFRAMYRMRKAGEEIDYITLIAQLTKTRELDAVGGQPYLAYLTEGIPRNPSIGSYIRLIKDASALRQLASVAEEMKREISEGGVDVKDLSARAKVSLELISDSARNSNMEHFGHYISNKYKDDPEAVFTQSAKLAGVAVGMDRFDAMTSTLQPGDMWVVGGRASMGKTAWAITVAKNITLAPYKPKTVAGFFLEQSKNSTHGRLLCTAAEASFKRYRDGELLPSERRRVRQAMDDFGRAPLFLECGKQITLTELKAKARRMKREVGLDLIICDQLSHLLADDFYRKGMQSHDIAGEKAKRFKAMLQELGVPGILLVQINRAATKNKDREGNVAPPTLADISESGQIEQHADGVMFLHRPGYYDRNNAELRNKGLQIIAKHRDGEVGEIECEYIGDSCLWLDKVAPGEDAGLFNGNAY